MFGEGSAKTTKIGGDPGTARYHLRDETSASSEDYGSRPRWSRMTSHAGLGYVSLPNYETLNHAA